MGKGLAWSESETIQLCLSWLEVSEDAVRGAGQKKSTFSSRLYSHWLENKRPEDKDPRMEVAIMGRWKKLQPEVTKFCGVYQDRHKQPFEFLAAWKELKDKPKWTKKITSASSIEVKRG
ncbi:hypothetical protein F443_05470 [Phytophthora nicotianae P1569]|uniref:No apical meristem-associated C-terminal domain-containing protein n=1 Tax=Phytophthora nicotianae P1569 TaxID=1317065 RepID=V9FI36_PHYNI|nr:hypothetical protein F443_05470 [Phytophthora nicotianae P1569]